MLCAWVVFCEVSLVIVMSLFFFFPLALLSAISKPRLIAACISIIRENLRMVSRLQARGSLKSQWLLGRSVPGWLGAWLGVREPPARASPAGEKCVERLKSWCS